ncbi:phosphate uptake regulator PhoU [Candidatus Bathyarchaeota archaeon]|jgi:phosphate uptake regulator|nr:MAG: phosphate uptake regulator PhoU [Candidatus Bathyarchaeota archaeon]
MDTRKIMALGKSSLVVSLPKGWIESNGLNKGDLLSLEVQRDLSLLIQPSLRVKDEGQRIVVALDESASSDSIFRIVIGCYLNGYNDIVLNSSNIFSVQQQQAIRNVVKSLYLRILSSTASSVTLQTLMNESMANIFDGIERMHIITLSMCHDTLKAMQSWDLELARSVVALEEDVDQFMFYLMRLIRSAAIDPALANRLHVDMLDCLDYQTLVDLIERVADNVHKVAFSLVQLEEHKEYIPDGLWKKLTETANASITAYEKAIEVFHSRSVESCDMIIDEQYKLTQLARSITPFPNILVGDPFFFPLFIIRDSLIRLGDYASDIAELTIDKAYKPE